MPVPVPVVLQVQVQVQVVQVAYSGVVLVAYCRLRHTVASAFFQKHDAKAVLA